MGDMEHIAIERLQAASEMSLHAYGLPLVITDSGGKDSQVCKILARRAGIPFEVMHSHTTADAPETVRFVRSEAKKYEDLGFKYDIIYPTYKGKPTSMWDLIVQKGTPPTRLIRFCCAILKETAGRGRFIATGVRWEESAARANNRGIYEFSASKKENRIILNNDNDDRRMLFENCRLKAKRTVNPIIDWQESDVWDFLDDSKEPVNPCYAMGFCRAGCVGCPMAGKNGREREFMVWPAYKNLYILAFRKLIERRKQLGKYYGTWLDGMDEYDLFNWWMEYDILPGQIDWFEEMEEEYDS